MLTIRPMSNGRGYGENHLVHRDDFAEGERVVGYWQGRGAAELGLVGDVRDLSGNLRRITCSCQFD